jgi:type II secretory pathway component PulM
MNAGIDTLNQWWRARSARERSLLLLMTATVLGFVGWYGIASPLRSAVERSDMHRARAAALLREVETSGAVIGHRVLPTDASLGDVLVLSAAEAGFTLEKHAEENLRETAVQGRAAEPAALFAWIEMLKTNHGLTVANLTAEREQDGSLRVDAVFVRGGS